MRTEQRRPVARTLIRLPLYLPMTAERVAVASPLYGSQLPTWRAQLKREGAAPKPPGRKPLNDTKDRRIEQLEVDKAKGRAQAPHYREAHRVPKKYRPGVADRGAADTEAMSFARGYFRLTEDRYHIISFASYPAHFFDTLG